jgi:hypothetical protein
VRSLTPQLQLRHATACPRSVRGDVSPAKPLARIHVRREALTLSGVQAFAVGPVTARGRAAAEGREVPGRVGAAPDKAKTRWLRLILAGRFDDELVHVDVGDTVRQTRPLRAATSPAPACDHSVLLVRQARVTDGPRRRNPRPRHGRPSTSATVRERRYAAATKGD